MRTHIVKPSQIDRKWFVVDAEGQPLGRLASHIAHLLRGKHKPTYSTHLDNGDFVVVVNAEKVAVHARYIHSKTYQRYSGYPSGLKKTPLGAMLKRKPTEILRHAVKGMLPHNSLGRHQLKKLKIYAGPEHPHLAQKPEPISFKLREGNA
jgi:large subunit ribosomal protein L13